MWSLKNEHIVPVVEDALGSVTKRMVANTVETTLLGTARIPQRMMEIYKKSERTLLRSLVVG